MRFALSLIWSASVGSACTSIILGPGAMEDGAPLTSHAADCTFCDNRIAFVPGKEQSENKRAIFDGKEAFYPRFLMEGRSEIYKPTQEYPQPFEPIGFVEQVPHTYALWESSYPLINEHGLAMGESTTYSKTELANAAFGEPDPLTDGRTKGTSLFVVAGLMTVAMERCKTARCAIQVMGELAEEHGFTGEEYATSEAVSIIDPNEAWVFEVSGDGSGSAVWAAEKVPTGHVAAITNTMIIKELDPSSPNQIFSKNVHSVAERFGFWSPDEGRLLNWQKDIGRPIELPRYSSLRLWRIFSRLAPSLGLPVSDDPYSFPFSVPVDRKVSLSEVFSIFGDHYEGTVFDMTKGALAGPHGNPNTELSALDRKAVEGGAQIPRAISMLRTSYTMIASSKGEGEGGVVWYGVDSPATSVWVPFFADTLREGRYSMERYGNQLAPRLQQFDRSSAFWAFDFVANYMQLNYRNMSQEMVYPKKEELQTWALNKADEAQRRAEGQGKEEKEAILGAAQEEIQETVAKEWWTLADELVVRYNDGYFNFAAGKAKTVGKAEPMSISPLWLRMIGASVDFWKPSLHWVQPAGPEALQKAESSEKALEDPLEARGLLGGWGVPLLLSGLCLFAGQLWGKTMEAKRWKAAKKAAMEGDYEKIA